MLLLSGVEYTLGHDLSTSTGIHALYMIKEMDFHRNKEVEFKDYLMGGRRGQSAMLKISVGQIIIATLYISNQQR